MSINGRLRALERRAPAGVSCRCGGVLPNCATYYDDEPIPQVPEKRCKDCGRPIEVLIIHVSYDSGPNPSDGRQAGARSGLEDTINK
jgi:hypothetical protein